MAKLTDNQGKRGLRLTNNAENTQRSYHDKFPVTDNNDKVKVREEDISQFLEQKFLDTQTEVVETINGEKKLKLINVPSFNFSNQFQENENGDLELNLSKIVDTINGTTFVNYSDPSSPKLGVQLHPNGGLDSDSKYGLNVSILKDKGLDIENNNLQIDYANKNDLKNESVKKPLPSTLSSSLLHVYKIEISPYDKSSLNIYKADHEFQEVYDVKVFKFTNADTLVKINKDYTISHATKNVTVNIDGVTEGYVVVMGTYQKL
jgi:hypothetical protein